MPRRSSQSLTILTGPSNKPIKSSRLAIPTSPFSPQYPITPLPRPAKFSQPVPTRATRSSQFPHAPPPPLSPLNWLWQCHKCHRSYRLGTTRRCLDDGHFFCSGTTVVKRAKRPGGRTVVKHKACSSEFDYQGWKVWGTWRRRLEEEGRRAALKEGRGVMVFGMEGLEPAGGSVRRRVSGVVFGSRGEEKDCWNECDYPSECRWGRQFGVSTPSPPPVSVPSSPLPAMEAQLVDEDVEMTSAVDTLLSSAAESSSASLIDEEARKPSMDDLLASAVRRKRRSIGAASSPLASNPPSSSPGEAEEGGSESAEAVQKSLDDSDLDIRRSFTELVSGFGMRRRGSAPSMTGDATPERRSGSSSWMTMKRKERSPSRRASGDI